MLTAKADKKTGDNPNHNQATNDPFADEYLAAACDEVETLEKMNAWEVVEREVGMNVLS